MRRVVLIRHAEAAKNREFRHGGPGSALTTLGRQQAERFADRAKLYFPDAELICYVAKPQCEETARIVAAKTQMRITAIENLQPFHLGVIDGLSDDEARLGFPEYARMMDLWRMGAIEICDVRIPGATDVYQFFEQGSRRLQQLLDGGSSIVVVGTRSVLVMMWNVMRGHSPRRGGEYFERPWDNCEWVEFLDDGVREWREVRLQRDRG